MPLALETAALPNFGSMADNSDDMDAVLDAGDKVEQALGEDKKAAESDRLQRESDEQDARQDELEREQAPAPPSSPSKVDDAPGGGDARGATKDERIYPSERTEAEAAKKLNGCLPAGLIGIIGAALIVAVVLVISSMTSEDAAPDPGPTVAAESSANPNPDASSTPSPDTSSDSTPEPAPASDSQAGGPPAVSSLPAGAILVKGRSGGPVGYIASDGQFRFMSLKSPGIVTGSPNSTNTPWTQDGQVLEFGARLSGANQGRYGVSIYIDGTTYGPGVAIEKGQRRAVTTFDGTNGPLKAGQQLSIIVGEAGNLDETGENSLQWWFVFQPDPAPAESS